MQKCSRCYKYGMGVLSGIAGVLALVVTAAGAEVRAVATTGMVAELVRRTGGDRVVVEQLMGPGVDPHLYKPTAGDVSALSRAEVIFYNGLHLEGRMGELLGKLTASGKAVVAVGEEIPPEDRIGVGGGQYDPHLWFDVGLWARTVPAVVRGLARVDPEGAEVYERNGKELSDRLAALDAWCRETLAAVPESRRVLVTSHDAFEYFGRAYGFRVVGLQGVSTVSEPGLADMAALADFLKKEKIPAIFVESSVNPAAIQRVAEDAGVTVGGEIFSDAMGAPGEMRNGVDTGTYEGMVKSNVLTIVRGLQDGQ